ncbi:MAG: hypothetical protein PWQ44_2400, partial [Methanolobus sp.]|nr:hypothetical protein [Methanolobus sp.]
MVGDVSDPNLFDMINTKNLAGILILSSDPKANKIALKNVREKVSPDIYCVVRAPDVINMQEMETLGADLVIMPPRMVAKSLSRSLERAEAMRRGNKLTQWFEENKAKKLGIVVHDNPDPDAISSALALKTIASSFNVLADIIYHGEIGHQENKAFVNLLGIDLYRSEDVGFTNYENLALVDCSMPGANNSLPLDTHVNIIIDHHPLPDADIDADFIDIRPGVGATASIMTQYLMELDIPVSKTVATALLYGIRADTRDFKRNVTPQDLNYAAFLLPLTDADLLDKITSPSVSLETIEIIGNAIRNRKINSGYLFSNVGYIRNISRF